MAKFKGREYSNFDMQDIYNAGCKIYVNDEEGPRDVEDVSESNVYFKSGDILKKRGNRFYRCIVLPFKVGDHGYYNKNLRKITSINIEKGYYEYEEEGGREWRAEINTLHPENWKKSNETFVDRRKAHDMRIAELFRGDVSDFVNGMRITFRIDPSFKEYLKNIINDILK